MNLKDRKCVGCQSKQDSCKCFACETCCKGQSSSRGNNRTENDKLTDGYTAYGKSPFLTRLQERITDFSYSELIRMERIVRYELVRRRKALLIAKRSRRFENLRQQSETKRKANEED